MVAKSYFVFGDSYARYDVQLDAVDPGYPKLIGSNWQGFNAVDFATQVDAAVNAAEDKVYFFKGDQYLRYDIAQNRVDGGYPLPTGDYWKGMRGVGFDQGIDAALEWNGGKVFFFKGSQYVRYDMTADRFDEGYPNSIADAWPGMADAGFDRDLDSAVNWGNGKVFFFKGQRYLRYDEAADRVDDGYPLDINSHWPGLGAARAGRPVAAIWVKKSGAIDLSRLSDAFFTSLKAVAADLQCSPEDLLGVMESESGVNPAAQNPHGKATGLIQFMPDILVGLGWESGPDTFRQLSAEDQLPYVRKYYHPHIGRLTSAGRLYQATFLPATLSNTSEDSVICARGGINGQFYEGNKILDTNHNGQITVSDLTARVSQVRSGPRWQELKRRLDLA